MCVGCVCVWGITVCMGGGGGMGVAVCVWDGMCVGGYNSVCVWGGDSDILLL